MISWILKSSFFWIPSVLALLLMHVVFLFSAIFIKLVPYTELNYKVVWLHVVGSTDFSYAEGIYSWLGRFVNVNSIYNTPHVVIQNVTRLTSGCHWCNMTRFIMSIIHCDSQCRHYLNFKIPLLLAFSIPHLILENSDMWDSSSCSFGLWMCCYWFMWSRIQTHV